MIGWSIGNLWIWLSWNQQRCWRDVIFNHVIELTVNCCYTWIDERPTAGKCGQRRQPLVSQWRVHWHLWPRNRLHQLIFHEISKYVDVQQSGMKQHPFTFQRTGNECCFNSITPSIGEGSRCGWKEALETSGLTYIKAILPLLSYHRQIALF